MVTPSKPTTPAATKPASTVRRRRRPTAAPEASKTAPAPSPEAEPVAAEAPAAAPQETPMPAAAAEPIGAQAAGAAPAPQEAAAEAAPPEPVPAPVSAPPAGAASLPGITFGFWQEQLERTMATGRAILVCRALEEALRLQLSYMQATVVSGFERVGLMTRWSQERVREALPSRER